MHQLEQRLMGNKRLMDIEACGSMHACDLKKGRRAVNADTVVHCDIDVMYMTSLLGTPSYHVLAGRTDVGH
ncbi:hypothetical protein F2Q69_00029644 [Brassica cretica]|uniref:Uncharacterized protein n=1 Tax=Brassica cretica TaxID=69181 RepID=A0A8S9S0N9_BRACR|nr:hypothetical protein F2Q69_00029644 [Brassica cretica]